jgi:Platelet-activating factor acetylhydrolase, isoform II
MLTLTTPTGHAARRLALAGLCLGLAAAAVQARPGPAAAGPPAQAAAPFRFSLPAPTGPHQIGTTELHLVDARRADPWVAGKRRELVVSVWYPAHGGGREPRAPYMRPGAAANFDRNSAAILQTRPGQVDWAGVRTHARMGAALAPRPGGHPVVLYSPGLGVPRTVGTVLVEELASRGYVVVTLDHTYETSEVEFPGGRVEVQKLPEQSPDVFRKALAVRVADTRFVLDQLTALRDGRPAVAHRLPRRWGRGLDLSRVGMFGHSAGGFTGGEAMVHDRRIDAGANLDGSMGYDIAAGDLGEVARRGLDRPFLLMGGRRTNGSPHTHHTDASWTSFWRHQRGWKLDLNVPAGQHYTFTDMQAIIPQLDAELDLADDVVRRFIGTVDPGRAVRAQQAYLPAFFDQHLRRRPQRLLAGPSPRHPDVQFVR